MDFVVYLVLLKITLANTLFIPVVENATSVFSYQMMGSGRTANEQLTMKSVFDLHIRFDKANKNLNLHVESIDMAQIGNKNWTGEIITALKMPFNISLTSDGAPDEILYDFAKETNYTIARKQLVMQQLTDIYKEYKKILGQSLTEKVNYTELDNMPFGRCLTTVNESLSSVYFTIEYHSKKEYCSGKVDPLFTMDMNVEVHTQSEFFKSFVFAKESMDFTRYKLDVLVKLESVPDMDVEIYTLITLKEILADPED